MADLRTSPTIKLPDISKIKDDATRDAFEQILRFLMENQGKVHDDLVDTNTAIPTVPAQASTAECEAATNNTKYTTPAGVKSEVQKAGAVAIPLDNIASIPESKLTIADNTTANASTSAHGFLKKLSNVATEFMNGVGSWVSVTIDSLLPPQTGNSGKFLTTDGSASSWASVTVPSQYLNLISTTSVTNASTTGNIAISLTKNYLIVFSLKTTNSGQFQYNSVNFGGASSFYMVGQAGVAYNDGSSVHIVQGSAALPATTLISIITSTTGTSFAITTNASGGMSGKVWLYEIVQ